jgi:hypothetical protein
VERGSIVEGGWSENLSGTGAVPDGRAPATGDTVEVSMRTMSALPHPVCGLRHRSTG